MSLSHQCWLWSLTFFPAMFPREVSAAEAGTRLTDFPLPDDDVTNIQFRLIISPASSNTNVGWEASIGDGNFLKDWGTMCSSNPEKDVHILVVVYLFVCFFRRGFSKSVPSNDFVNIRFSEGNVLLGKFSSQRKLTEWRPLTGGRTGCNAVQWSVGQGRREWLQRRLDPKSILSAPSS